MLLLTIFSELFFAKTCQRQCQRSWEFVGLHTCFMDRLQGHHSYRRAAAYVVVELGIPKEDKNLSEICKTPKGNSWS